MFRKDPSRSLLLLAMAASLAACGDDAAGGPADAGPKPGDTSTSTLLLTRVGAGVVEANPGDSITLLALLSRSEIGPVSGADVDFRIAENPGGTVLETATVATDATGVAASQLTVGASTGTVTVIASSEGAVSKAIWKINVVPLVKRLRIVPDSITVVDVNDPARADVAASPARQVPLRVRVSAESGEGERPLGGEEVTFTILQSIASTRFVGQSTLKTAANGEVAAILFAGDTTGEVVVHASAGGSLTATWAVHVRPPDGGGVCQSTAQCPADLVCRDGVCVGTSGGGGCDTNDRPCPIGYACNADSGLCELGVAPGCDHCPEFFHCSDDGTACVPDNPECTDEVPCPSGFECVNGLCATEDDPNVVDVSGYWYTKHKFDVREALPGWVKFTADGVQLIDQIVLGQLDLPSWANAIISGLVQQYVPSWVVTLVSILDAAFTVFSDLESEGEMDLARNGSRSILLGEEYWTKFVFHFLPLCNGNIQAPVGQQPACARMDIYTDELAAADLAVNVKPFAARVVGGGTPAKYTLFVDNRTVDMNFQGLLMYALDFAVELATGYPSVEEALPALIDCPGLAQMVRDIGLPMDVTGLCRTAVAAGTKAIVDRLSGANITQRDTLSFRGSATAHPSQIDPLKADLLGYPDYLTRPTADGAWNGRFKMVLGVEDVPGRWRAAREPFPAGH